MQRFVTEYFGKAVLLKKERAMVGTIDDFVINPEDGRFLGVIVKEGFGKNNLKALPEKDIEVAGKDFLLISGYEKLGDIDEIIRISQVVNKDIKIITNKVYTETGQYLGRVFDYTLDFSNFYLSRLYISRILLGVPINQYIVAKNQIIEIGKEKIVVKDATIKIKSSKTVSKPIPSSG